MPESVLMMFGMLLTILIGTAIIIVIVVNLREMEKKEHTGLGKANSYSASSSYSSKGADKNKDVQISKNIYDAIETFARLCHAWKMKTGWPYEAADFAWIKVQYANACVTLEMSCRGDCLALWVPENTQNLIADSDNIVRYESKEVHSLKIEEPRALWEAFRAGSPNAVLENIDAAEGRIFVNIKYQN